MPKVIVHSDDAPFTLRKLSATGQTLERETRQILFDGIQGRILGGPNSMKGESAERWIILCGQAAEEQDPTKLLELVKEINRLLEEKERRPRKRDSEAEPSAPEA